MLQHREYQGQILRRAYFGGHGARPDPHTKTSSGGLLHEHMGASCRLANDPYRSLLAWCWNNRPKWESIEGFQVSVFPSVSDADSHQARQSTREALQLLGSLEPRLLRRAAREMPRILIRPIPNAKYHVFARICMLDLVTAKSGSPGAIASTILHETIHARIAQRGIAYTKASKDRIERVCILPEIDFVHKLPDHSYPGKAQWLEQLQHYARDSRVSNADVSHES